MNPEFSRDAVGGSATGAEREEGRSLKSQLSIENPVPRSGERLGEVFHLLALDAFSGDSVPVHLLTKEAFETYLAHLPLEPASGEVAAATGPLASAESPTAIAVNISNRYVDLKPVMRAVADHFHLAAVHIHARRRSGIDATYSSDWIILTRNQKLFERLDGFAAISTKTPHPPILWTDTHSSLFDVLK
jgi:hypothetical protein